MAEEAAKKQKKKLTRSESTRYMTLQQAADHYCVTEAAIRQGCGPLKQLRTVKIGKRRLVLRSDVDALDRKLERGARSLVITEVKQPKAA